MTDKTDPRLRFDRDGHLTIQLYGDNIEWREAVCPLCNQPIPWVLDMMSFVNLPGQGVSMLAHAACTWKPEAFKKQAKRAEKNPGRWPQ